MAEPVRLPRFREARRATKAGVVTYFYWDGRGHGRPDVPLGSDRDRAIEVWQQCELGKFPKRRSSRPAALRKPGRRRNLGPQWVGVAQWQRSMYLNAERRASELHRPFTLTPVEFFAVLDRAGGRCEISGLPFELGSSRSPYAPSLDRIDCAKGYEAGNVRIVCHIVNVAMNTWGIEPLRRVAEALCGNTFPARCGNSV